MDKNSKNTTIDLSKCKKGDKLRIRLNEHFIEKGISDIVVYDGPLPENNFYDHAVIYSDGSRGTRNNDGSTFKIKKLPNDPDVIEIIGEK